MKAVVCTRYGPPEVLQLREVPRPKPADNEVLIKVFAASVNPLDAGTLPGPLVGRLLTGGWFSPRHKILGGDISGRVVAGGVRTKQFRPGDEVFGGLIAGMFGGKGLGGFAEYVCATEDKLALKPSNLSFEQAAAVPIAAITALQGLRNIGRAQPGDKVLIDGASGGVGTFAVQIAKSLGAEVTAVCSTGKVDTARSVGADHVIDYSREDFAQSESRYDLIFGANAHRSISDYRRALKKDGVFVIAGGGFPQMLEVLCLGPVLSRAGKSNLRSFLARMNSDDLVVLKDLLESGKVVPVIDRRYSLSEVPDAIRYLGQGHARGKVVICVQDDSVN